MKAYKISNSDIKLYFDIIDLWPETMPISKFKNVFPFSLWKNIRDKNLEYGDIIFTECELFQEVLKQERNEKYKTLLWANREIPKPLNTADFKSDEIVYCYLGSINNIIDIDLIIKILLESKKYKKTSIQIIGKGEGKDIFVGKIKFN